MILFVKDLNTKRINIAIKFWDFSFLPLLCSVYIITNKKQQCFSIFDSRQPPRACGRVIHHGHLVGKRKRKRKRGEEREIDNQEYGNFFMYIKLGSFRKVLVITF